MYVSWSSLFYLKHVCIYKFLLTLITFHLIVLIFVSGIILGNFQNLVNSEHGGFFPFGLAGVVKGASMALYACSGFETIALSSEVNTVTSRA